MTGVLLSRTCSGDSTVTLFPFLVKTILYCCGANGNESSFCLSCFTKTLLPVVRCAYPVCPLLSPYTPLLLSFLRFYLVLHFLRSPLRTQAIWFAAFSRREVRPGSRQWSHEGLISMPPDTCTRLSSIL